jgi:hypothetical protein
MMTGLLDSVEVGSVQPVAQQCCGASLEQRNLLADAPSITKSRIIDAAREVVLLRAAVDMLT